MSVSSRSSSGSRNNNKHIFDEINEHMFSSENLNRWTRFLTEEAVVQRPTRKVRSRHSTPPKNADIQTTNIWRPRSRDKLFWSLYVICNGPEGFDRVRDRLFKAETDFKYSSVEKTRTRLSALKAEKVKVQELEAEIVSAKTMTIETLRALAIVYQKSIIFKNEQVYYDMPFGDTYYILEKNNNDIALHLGDVSAYVEKIKSECFYVDPHKKIKGISAYTVKDLRDMANKLLVDTNVAGKQLNKQQLYANINTKLTKLT